MTEKSLKRCAMAVLCVLLISLLAPAFAQGVASVHDHFDSHVSAAANDHVEDIHHPQHHGHDLEEHDNLAHMLDHLSAKLTDLPSAIAPGIAHFTPPESAASLLRTAPSSLYRPPRRLFLA